MDRDARALLLGLSAVLLWSTSATAFKLALKSLDVFQLLFYASATSALALLAVVARRGQLAELPAYFRATPAYCLGMAALNPCLFYLVLLTAYDLLPAQQAQAINYTWAITLSLMAIPLLGQMMHRRDVIAALGGYCGVLIIATRGDVLGLRFDSVTGVLLALLSTVIWATYWIAGLRRPRDAAVSLCINFILAVPISGLVCLAFSSLAIPDWRGLAAAVYVGLFEMGITFLFWSTALKTATRVTRVGNLIFLSPFFSMIFIQAVLGEDIHPATLLGLCLIVPATLYQQLHRPQPA
jgi:drug/metabolite transporter (DMT)-like permease